MGLWGGGGYGREWDGDLTDVRGILGRGSMKAVVWYVALHFQRGRSRHEEAAGWRTRSVREEKAGKEKS